VTPLRRAIIIDAGDHYRTGTFEWRGAVTRLDDERILKSDAGADVQQAREAPTVAAFLTWSRFPFWTVEPTAAGRRVTVRDMRFGDRFSASVTLK